MEICGQSSILEGGFIMRMGKLIGQWCMVCLPALLGAASWQFSNGPEFKGATGKLSEKAEIFLLEGDFSGGGSYVAISRKVEKAENPFLFRFAVKGRAKQVAVRFSDSDGQTHQHFLPLAGKGKWEEVAVRVSGSVEHHWGGKNDGVLRLPLRRIAIVTHRGDYADKRAARLEIKGIHLDSAIRQSEYGFAIPQVLYKSYRSWQFNNGPEFKGANGSLEYIAPDVLRLNGDFTGGGSYVAAWHRLAVPLPLTAVSFRVRSASKGTDVRFVGADGQTHQHYVTLSGNPEEIQEITVQAVGSQKHHWGGEKDGVLRQPVRDVVLSIHGSLLPGKKGSVDYSDIVFFTSDPTRAGSCEFEPVAPEKLFRTSKDESAFELKLLRMPDVPDDALGMFTVTDYQGKKIGSGSSVKFDRERMQLTVPAFPGYTGFLEYTLPGLGIRFGVQQSDMPEKAADEFFGIDSSFSWGSTLLAEPLIRAYCRILKRNGIIWNRDRLNWNDIQPEEKTFFYRGNFALYRKIAAEEGIRTLDTFHSTPAWARPARDAKKFGPTPYPTRLEAAGKSWVEIIRHYQSTLHALEVWNEPDISLGAYLPAERVSALTKAISYAVREAGIDTRIVGGVFAHPWPGTVFQDAYIANALLDTCDVVSYHTYAGVESMEPTIRGLRERELALKHPRAGIPIWITESGTPWYKRGNRATLPEDIASAAGIVGKALEFRALGVERYFAFEYKYYQEGEKNFGMMDFHHTPMRSMAAYVFAARLFAGKGYIGDLIGTSALRARVFSDGNEAVVFFYQPQGVSEIVLPDGIRGELLGADGRALLAQGRKFRCPDRIAYLRLPAKELVGRVNVDTIAMKYYRLARNFDRAPRKTAPVIFRSELDVSNMTFNPFGYNICRFRDVRFDVELQNCSGRPEAVRPELTLPTGVTVLENIASEVELVPGETVKLSFRVSIDPEEEKDKFKLLRISDRNGNALPFAFSVRAWEMLTKEVPPLPEEQPEDFKLAELLSAPNWTDFSASENWKSWQGGEIEPNIEAKFRAFHGNGKLQIQVLVKDRSFHQPYKASEAWRGDSLQLALQQRGTDRMPPARRYWNEVTVAQTGKTGTIFGHKGNPAGLAHASKLNFIPLGQEYWLYVVDFDAKEFGLNLSPGSVIGFSLLVNSNSGKGRDGFLAWGQGISDSKSPEVFNCLVIK